MNFYDDIDGDDDDDVGFEVVGDVMGDVMGDDYEIIGARRKKKRRGGGGLIRVRKPGWRKNQVAPGVQGPQEGLIPLPLDGVQGNIFTAAIQQITFQGGISKTAHFFRFHGYANHTHGMERTQ